MNENNKRKFGWICPVCGAVMSPEQVACVYCAPIIRNGGLYNAPYIDVDYTKTISNTESHYDKWLTNINKEK